MVGCSEGTYHKLDKIFQSENEEIKQKVDSEEISINKAYKEIKGTDKDKTSKIIRRCIICKQEKPILEFRDVDDDQYYSHCRSCNKDIEAKKHKIISNLQTGLKTSDILELDPTPVQKTVADYDKEIAEIEAEIAALYEMKTKVIQDRHKVFQADNSELRCECERSVGLFGLYDYTFFLVKNNSKIGILTFGCPHYDKGIEDLLKSIDIYLRSFEREQHTTLTNEEKQVIIAEIISMKDQVLHDKEQHLKEAREQDKIVNDAWKKMFDIIENSFTPNLTDQQRAWLKPVFRDAAFKYHPDVNQNEDATEAMQFINRLKESFGL